MLKIAALVWVMLGTTLAGIAMTAILSVPQLAEQSTRLIPMLCSAGFVLAMPISYLVAKKIASTTSR
ncbi:MAG TPA: hypothetical protein PK264_22630 [Hyphomicrobiaceae bacterium]|nr:hypothetical protein [Hyphomicrobiaceae bacterium]